jgi:hypothetical protein
MGDLSGNLAQNSKYAKAVTELKARLRMFQEGNQYPWTVKLAC